MWDTNRLRRHNLALAVFLWASLVFVSNAEFDKVGYIRATVELESSTKKPLAKHTVLTLEKIHVVGDDRFPTTVKESAKSIAWIATEAATWRATTNHEFVVSLEESWTKESTQWLAVLSAVGETGAVQSLQTRIFTMDSKRPVVSLQLKAEVDEAPLSLRELRVWHIVVAFISSIPVIYVIGRLGNSSVNRDSVVSSSDTRAPTTDRPVDVANQTPSSIQPDRNENQTPSSIQPDIHTSMGLVGRSTSNETPVYASDNELSRHLDSSTSEEDEEDESEKEGYWWKPPAIQRKQKLANFMIPELPQSGQVQMLKNYSRHSAAPPGQGSSRSDDSSLDQVNRTVQGGRRQTPDAPLHQALSRYRQPAQPQYRPHYDLFAENRGSAFSPYAFDGRGSEVALSNSNRMEQMNADTRLFQQRLENNGKYEFDRGKPTTDDRTFGLYRADGFAEITKLGGKATPPVGSFLSPTLSKVAKVSQGTFGTNLTFDQARNRLFSNPVFPGRPSEPSTSGVGVHKCLANSRDQTFCRTGRQERLFSSAPPTAFRSSSFERNQNDYKTFCKESHQQADPMDTQKFPASGICDESMVDVASDVLSGFTITTNRPTTDTSNEKKGNEEISSCPRGNRATDLPKHSLLAHEPAATSVTCTGIEANPVPTEVPMFAVNVDRRSNEDADKMVEAVEERKQSRGDHDLLPSPCHVRLSGSLSEAQANMESVAYHRTGCPEEEPSIAAFPAVDAKYCRAKEESGSENDRVPSGRAVCEQLPPEDSVTASAKSATIDSTTATTSLSCSREQENNVVERSETNTGTDTDRGAEITIQSSVSRQNDDDGVPVNSIASRKTRTEMSTNRMDRSIKSVLANNLPRYQQSDPIEDAHSFGLLGNQATNSEEHIQHSIREMSSQVHPKQITTEVSGRGQSVPTQTLAHQPVTKEGGVPALETDSHVTDISRSYQSYPQNSNNDACHPLCNQNKKAAGTTDVDTDTANLELPHGVDAELPAPEIRPSNEQKAAVSTEERCPLNILRKGATAEALQQSTEERVRKGDSNNEQGQMEYPTDPRNYDSSQEPEITTFPLVATAGVCPNFQEESEFERHSVATIRASREQTKPKGPTCTLSFSSIERNIAIPGSVKAKSVRAGSPTKSEDPPSLTSLHEEGSHAGKYERKSAMGNALATTGSQRNAISDKQVGQCGDTVDSIASKRNLSGYRINTSLHADIARNIGGHQSSDLQWLDGASRGDQDGEETSPLEGVAASGTKGNFPSTAMSTCSTLPPHSDCTPTPESMARARPGRPRKSSHDRDADELDFESHESKNPKLEPSKRWNARSLKPRPKPDEMKSLRQRTATTKALARDPIPDISVSASLLAVHKAETIDLTSLRSKKRKGSIPQEIEIHAPDELNSLASKDSILRSRKKKRGRKANGCGPQKGGRQH